MKLNARVSKLELKNRQLGPALVLVRDGESKEEAFQRCYSGDKPANVIYLDYLDMKL